MYWLNFKYLKKVFIENKGKIINVIIWMYYIRYYFLVFYILISYWLGCYVGIFVYLELLRIFNMCCIRKEYLIICI